MLGGRFGAAAVKSRFTRSGAGVCRGSCRVEPPRQPRRRNARCQPCPAGHQRTARRSATPRPRGPDGSTPSPPAWTGWDVDALLIRPDGRVAWALPTGRTSTPPTLARALGTWFRRPA
ncbi:hypothetical protein [Actinoplanes sp. NPDC026623]|uniref:aromatic-ring hydroxylase C-terminal domain-containing protein n=1 Tax=Actinoplanes sp. NPDC026623 TaxID=3155610 RepID=UPI0033C1E472